MTRHIVIMGLMGSGKTTLGRSLASRLGWPFVDNDGVLEARARETARAIADVEGIDRLHALEADVLIDALAATEPAVIDAAASTIDDARCRAELERPELFSIWLRGSAEVLAQRAGSSDYRPFEHQSIADVLAEQARVRNPLFAQVADLTIDVDARMPGDVLEVAVAGLPADLRPR